MLATHAILSLIDQMRNVLDQFEPHDYRKPLPEYHGSSIGQHFRHILEFFQCLEAGVPTGEVDFAARQRNMMYEDNPRLASSALEAIAESLSNYNLESPVMVKAEFGGANRPLYQSTVGRELLFAYDHAIHHLAIIKIGLYTQFPDIQIDKDFGVSPSTIKFRQSA